MNYIERINDLIEKTILKNTTSKILQHMGRIRNESSLDHARRWVMELIQNARDVAFDDGIKIRIALTDDELVFSHTGKPFRVKDILSIINQASSKDDSIETVGKFGTGFVTTFQLSESVLLESVLCDEGEKAIPFSVVLDRSGTIDAEVQKSIENSLSQLKNCILEDRDFLYDEKAYNTRFVYKLGSSYEKDIAKTGIEDLKNAVNEILLFSDKINEIEVVIDTEHEKKNVRYFANDNEVLDVKNSIYRKDFRWVMDETFGTQIENHSLLYINSKKMTLCVGVDEDRNILEFDDNKSRLFIDFPLIGSEKFPFPIIINNRELAPNEPRSGISLVDNERSYEARSNKEVISEAVAMYGQLLEYLVNNDYGCIWNMIRIPNWSDNPELSEVWVKNNIYNRLYQIISKLDIVGTDKGKTALNNSWLRIVDAVTDAEKNDVYWLLKSQDKYYVANNDVDWIYILEGYNFDGNIINVVGIKSLLSNSKDIVNSFEEDNDAINWINRLYKACMSIEEYAVAIKSATVSIYPTQRKNSFNLKYGARELFPHHQIYEDATTDGFLREIAECFFGFDHMKDFRTKLVDKRFKLVDGDLLTYTDEDVARHIRECVSYVINNYKLDKVHESVQLGCAKLAEWLDLKIETDANIVNLYFPEFSSEENRAKLLTPKAVAAINKENRSLRESIEILRKQLDKCYGSDYLSDDKEDIIFSLEDLDGFDGTKDDFARMVGREGEKAAYEALRDLLTSIDGEQAHLISDMDGFAVNNNYAYKVIIMDTDDYKQAGYDILVNTLDIWGNIVAKDYFEVKTHTLTSIKVKEIHLSEEQMKLALKEQAHYHVMKVRYDSALKKCVDIKVISNVSQKISEGSLRHIDNGYSYVA